MSDSEIALAVRRLLATLLDDLDTVQVEVEQSIAYLEGIARTAAQKEQIDQLVRRVPGVEQVVNCLALEHLAYLPAEPALDILPPPLPAYELSAPESETFGTS